MCPLAAGSVGEGASSNSVRGRKGLRVGKAPSGADQLGEVEREAPIPVSAVRLPKTRGARPRGFVEPERRHSVVPACAFKASARRGDVETVGLKSRCKALEISS